MGRAAAALLWALIVGLAFGLGPPNRPETGAAVVDLLVGRWSGHPPWWVAHFQWMGLWPLWMAMLLRAELRARVPAWPFVLASFGLGCFALLPWMALRPSGPRPGPPAEGLSGSPVLPLGAGAAGAALVGWAAATGSPSDWAALFLGDGFTWAMTVDFVAFWVVSVVEARARLSSAHAKWAWLPGVGLAAALALHARARRWAT